jgi:hypothetical protein
MRRVLSKYLPNDVQCSYLAAIYDEHAGTGSIGYHLGYV